MQDIVIVEACRTAIGDFGGGLKDVAPCELGELVVRNVLERAGVAAADVGHVVFGHVINTEPRDMYLSRVAALNAGIPQAVPAFTEHFYDSEDEGDESVDNGPTGGLTWDGRADRGRDQARIPLLSPFEMANKDEAAVVASLSRAPYADAFKAAFGDDVFDHPGDAFDAAVEALGTFEQSSADFYPYSSRYDAFLAGKAQLTARELHGRALFEDEAKGNCASCHLSEPSNNGEPPQFTDYGLIAVAAPRNAAIPANADPAYVDLGLCGPLRTDFKGRADYCGLFKTPTLRNVALRKSFFHNGAFHTLRDAVAFYASRDSDPGRWYPRNADGTVDKYDDLPKAYWKNLNQDPPFGRKPGDKPALTDADQSP